MMILTLVLNHNEEKKQYLRVITTTIFWLISVTNGYKMRVIQFFFFF